MPERKSSQRSKKTAGTGQKMKSPSAVQLRLLDGAAAQTDESASMLHLHTALAQTSMPYRDPGDEIRVWDRRNGSVYMRMAAGDVVDPEAKQWIKLGLPFGPKARLILAHLNTEALQTGNPVIETEDTLTRFVSKALGMDTKGRNIRTVKDQLTRLAACTIRLGIMEKGKTVQVQSQLVSGFELWSKREDEERVIWPEVIRLSTDYFQSLQKHAVPLNEAHLVALSHSAMALDIYAWLAQRLHRVNPGEPALITWTSLHEQFGVGYESVRKFRQVFLVALNQVLTVYRAAHVEHGGMGLTLHSSPTPVPPMIAYSPCHTGLGARKPRPL